jgi:hypothetical protein
MRRTIFLALLAALLFAPATRASTDPIRTIQRDCSDSVLQGSYSVSDLRKARETLPTDADEYSDCRDVLSRAIAQKTANSGGGDTSGTPDATATATPATTADPGAPAQPETKSDDSTVATDPGVETGPVTPQDWNAVAGGTNEGGRTVAMKGRDVSAMLAADVGRNGLPGTLLIALALLGVGSLVALLLPLLRRVTGNWT